MGDHDQDLYRDFGRLEAEVSSLAVNQAHLIREVKELKELLTAAKGGWKVILFIAGGAATVGALLAKVFTVSFK